MSGAGDRTQANRRLLVATTEYPPYAGGIGTYASEIARAAAGLGWRTRVWAPDYGRRDTHEASGAVDVLRYRGGVPARRELARLMGQFVAALARTRPTDVVLCSWPDTLCASALQLDRFCRCVVVCHGTELLTLPASGFARLMGYRRFMSRVQVIACNSAFTASLVGRAGLRPEGELRVTHLGVSPFWGEAVDRTAARRRWAIPEGHWLLSTVARLDERKGQDLAIQALARLPPELQSRIAYLVVGQEVDHEYAARLRVLAAETGARVTFTGQLSDEDVREIYGASDLFILSGRNSRERVEGFGLVLLEAALQRVPALVTATGGVPEVVVDGETGIVVPGFEPELIADAIRGTLEAPEALKAMGLNACARAQAFTWTRTAERTLAD
jgi:phosphatidylinositol alpha-1,6-mannosyltransferase